MSRDPLPQRRRVERRLALAVLRVLALVLALQVTGMLHAATDVASVVFQLEQHEHEQCPNDGSCNDCLAGCPNCHCANAMRLLVPEASASFSLPPRVATTACWASIADAQHPRPELPSVYRPPRVAAFRSS